MSLIAGTRLGPYEIIAPIGAGGMGEVYRARDSKLDRDVAIKVLPESFAFDPDRVARFTREAKTLAALNHTNIAQIFGIEDGPAPAAGGPAIRGLVMELVEGDDLSVLIARGPIPLHDALPIARQIADALEAAHEQGIIHRDLKPANIKVRADGTVKVLDFGLARSADAPSGSTISNSPTLTARATQMGMIIGTAAYMSPEQARGRSVDRRADIWAFGAVLFEMLTGRRVFGGDDISDVLASVLKSDPDWTLVPGSLPAPIRRLLRRCLEKDPKARLSSIGDARLELNENEPVAPSIAAPTPAPARSSWSRWMWPAVTFAAIAVAAYFAREAPATTGAETRTSIVAPAGEQFYPDSVQVAISPDGSQVAFIAGNPQVPAGIWVRPINSLTARRIEGTADAELPFWSPDSKRIGFFTAGKLRTVAATGGVIQTVCSAPGSGGRGATWNAAGVIIFALDSGPLRKVPATGGEPEVLTTVGSNQSSHRFPSFLPDGDHFLYAALPSHSGKFDIFVGALSGGPGKLIGQMESAPVYAAPGYLLFSRQNALAAERFDLKSLTLIGESISLPDQPTSIMDPATSFTSSRVVSVSNDGALAYFSSPATNTVPTWFDMSGKPGGTVRLPDGEYSDVKIAPDGTHAMFVRSTSVTESTLWLADLVHGGAVPFSSGPGRNDSPVWSRDGKRVVFSSDRDGPQNFFVKNVADSSPEQPFFSSPVMFKNPEGFSTDGKFLFYQSLDPNAAQNIHLLPLTGEQKPITYVAGPLRDFLSDQSPDGRHVAYSSDETGRFEIYVDSYPTAGEKRQVSSDGGLAATWTPDGRHLLYVGPDMGSLWRADVAAGATISIGAPVRLFSFPPSGAGAFEPKSQRLLALIPERRGAGSITIVQNWLHK